MTRYPVEIEPVVARPPAATDPPRPSRTVPDAERTFHLARRQALIIELGAIEDYLGMERSIIPKHRRPEAGRRTQN